MLLRHFAKNTLLLAFVFTCQQGFGQQSQKRTPEQRAENQVQWMDKNLGLTEAQHNKAYNIVLHYAQEADKEMASTPPGQDRKMERQDINNNRDADLKQVLTGEQFQKYQAHAQEMKERMMQRRSNMGQQPGRN